MSTLADIELDGSLQSVKELFLLIACELGPAQALAAMEVEIDQLSALGVTIGSYTGDEEDMLNFAAMAQNLRNRLAFLESITEEVATADCCVIDDPPKPNGPWLCWINPAKIRSAA